MISPSIPLAPLEKQNDLTSSVEAEKKQILSLKNLIESYEAKIQAVIAKLRSE